MLSNDILNMIEEAWKRPFSTRSNQARENAEIVAICSCEGFITTRLTADAYGNTWRVTGDGLALLEEAGRRVETEDDEDRTDTPDPT